MNNNYLFFLNKKIKMKKNLFRFSSKNIQSSLNIINIKELRQKFRNHSLLNYKNNNNQKSSLVLNNVYNSFLSLDLKTKKKKNTKIIFKKSLKHMINSNYNQPINLYNNILNDSKKNNIINQINILKDLIKTSFNDSNEKSNNKYKKIESCNNFLSDLCNIRYKNNQNKNKTIIKIQRKNTLDLSSDDFSQIKNNDILNSDISDSLDIYDHFLISDEIYNGFYTKTNNENNITFDEEKIIPELINKNSKNIKINNKINEEKKNNNSSRILENTFSNENKLNNNEKENNLKEFNNDLNDENNKNKNNNKLNKKELNLDMRKENKNKNKLLLNLDNKEREIILKKNNFTYYSKNKENKDNIYNNKTLKKYYYNNDNLLKENNINDNNNNLSKSIFINKNNTYYNNSNKKTRNQKNIKLINNIYNNNINNYFIYKSINQFDKLKEMKNYYF